MKHTPTPYAIEGNVSAGGIVHYAITNRSNGNEWMVCSITPMHMKRDVDVANAEFIVKACNNHKALLDALKEAQTCLLHNRIDTGPLPGMSQRIRYAITESEREAQ